MRILKQGLIWLLVVVLLIPVPVTVVSAATDWDGYTPISSVEDLENIRNNLSGNYYLTTNIIFPEDPECTNNWTPIGTSDTPFTGIFDGNGYRIEGLRVDHVVSSYKVVNIGLFGYCKGTVKNLGLENCRFNVESDYSTTIYIGGVAAQLEGGTISQCYFTGSILGDGGTGRYGGIVGNAICDCYDNQSSIIDCYNLASITSITRYSWVGGIVANNEGLVTHCYNAGKLFASNPRGVVGYDVYSTIIENYFLKNGATNSCAKSLTDEEMQIAEKFVGFDFNDTWCFRKENGFNYPELKNVPLNMKLDSFEITKKPDGVIISEETDTFKSGGGTMELKYLNGFVVSGSPLNNAEVSGIATDKQGEQLATYSYKGKSAEALVEVGSVAGGFGTVSDPYRISSTAQLNNVRLNLGANYILTTDLTFAEEDFAEGGSFYNEGKLWKPIGVDEGDAFTGTFNGDNHSIYGLRINIAKNADTTYFGLFGYVTGSIENLKIRKILIDAYGVFGYVGGIAGFLCGSIYNCHLESGLLSICQFGSERDRVVVGGIVGATENGIISGCHNAAYVESESYSTYIACYAGGIAGIAWNGTIDRCYNTGCAGAYLYDNGGQGSSYGGGIVGSLSGGRISNCYNIGESRASYGNGGIAGSSEGRVIDCYNISRIDRGRYMGAIVGVNRYGYIGNCYYLNNNNSDAGDGSDYAIQCTPKQMKTTTTFRDFDFNSVWTIDGDKRYAYPELRTNALIMIATIVKEPLDASADNGKTVKTTVTVTGDGLKYSWYAKDTTEESFKETSVTTATYKCTMSKSVNGRKVYCVITDEYGNTEKTNTVTLSNLTIKTQPVGKAVADGKTVSVSVKATGSGLKYSWYIKKPTAKTFTKTSTTTSSYKCTMSKTYNGLQVYCVITDKFGNSVRTNTVTLSNLAVKTQPKNNTAANGKIVKTTVTATGTGLKYCWYVKNATDKTFKKTSVTTATYKCTMSKSVNGRKVYCVITDKYGNTVRTKTVTLSNLVIKTQPVSKTVANGKTVKTTVSATGVGLKYRWYIKDTTDKTFKKTSVTTATYKCTMNKKSNGRKAYCIITDKHGNSVRTNTVTFKKR